MKVLQSSAHFKILAILMGINNEKPLNLIELAGRTAYQSRDKITNDSAERFVRMLLRRGHESVLEHSCMTVEFDNVSRGFTHELVRHRLASYTQESTRYVDEKEFKVVAPPHKNVEDKIVKLTLPGEGKSSFLISFSDWISLNEQMYRGLREAGWLPQDARQILPIGITSQIVITANFREWRHIFKLRCSPDAHWEIREAMLALLKEVKKRIPVIFDDFEIAPDGKSIILK